MNACDPPEEQDGDHVEAKQWTTDRSMDWSASDYIENTFFVSLEDSTSVSVVKQSPVWRSCVCLRSVEKKLPKKSDELQ